MITEIPAHHARATLNIDGRPYDVVEVEGEESLNLGYLLQVVLLAQPHQGPDEFLGRRFILKLLGRDGDTRRIDGVVSEVLEDLSPAARKRITLSLKPRFRDLELTRGPVLWIGLDFKGLVQSLLEETGIHGVRVAFDFQSGHPVRPWQLRGVGENSQAMLARHLAKEGIFCWVDSHEHTERLVFTDHNACCPYVGGGALREVPELGLETMRDGHPRVGVFAIEEHQVLQPGAAIGYVTPPAGPARPRTGEPRASDRPGWVSGFGVAHSFDEAEAWAKLRNDYHDQQSRTLHIRANRVDLAPGYCVTLESELFAGDYLITRVRHRTAQAAGPLARGATLPYTCEAWLIPRARTYRSPSPPKRRQPDIVEARLVSNSPYASLDRQGRYRVRTLFEPGLLPFGRQGADELTHLRRLSPHGGPRDTFGQPTGFHPPGLDDEPVLLACLNDDPDQLCVLGGTYDARRAPPVIDENVTQNLYRTVNGNTLLMDDRRGCEAVRLHPVDGLLYLELNAEKAAHWAGIVTPQGAIEQHAGKLIAFKSRDTHLEQIGNDRIQQVENRSVTTTRKGKIHHQAGSDIRLRAGESIHIEAGQDVEITAGGDFSLSAEQEAVFQVRHGDQLIRVNRGEVHIQAAKDIWIEGDGSGPITLMQNDGGVQIGTQGDMRLFGNAFSAAFEQIDMSGEIHYEVPGGAPAPKLSLRPPPEPVPIEDLIDPREPKEKRLEQETVALLPVRYAIDKRAEGEALYAYSAAQLDKGLPQLGQARYVLRRPRTGWLYLVLMNQLYEFEIDDNASLIPKTDAKPALEAAEIRLENQALLLPKSAGHAWLAYSEHPWTEKQRQKIEANTAGCRNRQMQRFAFDAPGQDAFALSELNTQVADYGGPGGDFAWSDSPGNIAYDLNGLRAELTNEAEAGQQVVALHDPIGISRDLTALIEASLEALAEFMAKPDAQDGKEAQAQYRKRIIAETIERIYQSRYNPGTDTDTLTRLRQEHWRAEPANRGTAEPSPLEFERQVRADMAESPHTERYAKHVDEEARQAFLNDFNADFNKQQAQIDNRRQDRLAWLNTWNMLTQPQWLGAAWDTFDLDDEADWQHFEHSFARSQASLIGMPPNRKEGLPDLVMNKEIALFDAWLATPPETSPVYRALFGYAPLRQATEEYMAARESDAQAEQAEAQAPQTGEQTLTNPTTAAEAIDPDETIDPAKATATGQHDENLFNRAIDTAADRSASLTEATANLLEQFYQRFPYTIGTQSIVTTYTAYVLNKPAKWNGAVTGNIQSMLARLFNKQWIKALMYALEVRYGQFVTKVTHTVSQFQKLFIEATGKMPLTAVPKVTASNTGNLKRDGIVTFEISEQRVVKEARLGKGVANPFKGVGTAGISAIAGLLYLVNLKRAVFEFDSENRLESSSNLLSAIAAIGSGINSGLLAFENVAPKTFDSAKQALYSRSAYLAQRQFVERLMSVGTLRFFGYAGAFLSGATLGIRGGKLINQGDTDAGLWYAGAAVAVTTGGSALTYVGAAALAAKLAGVATATVLLTPAGWFVLGIALLVGSFALQWTGEAAKDDDIEKWLDACTFGKRDRFDVPEYNSLAEEMDALGYALHAPKQIEMDWSLQLEFNNYLAEAVVYLPGYDNLKSRLEVTANGVSIVPFEYERQGGGSIVSLRYYVRKSEGIDSVTYNIRYRPSDAFDKDYTLTVTVHNDSQYNDPTIPGP